MDKTSEFYSNIKHLIGLRLNLYANFGKNTRPYEYTTYLLTSNFDDGLFIKVTQNILAKQSIEYSKNCVIINGKYRVVIKKITKPKTDIADYCMSGKITMCDEYLDNIIREYRQDAHICDIIPILIMFAVLMLSIIYYMLTNVY